MKHLNNAAPHLCKAPEPVKGVTVDGVVRPPAAAEVWVGDAVERQRGVEVGEPGAREVYRDGPSRAPRRRRHLLCRRGRKRGEGKEEVGRRRGMVPEPRLMLQLISGLETPRGQLSGCAQCLPKGATKAQ